MHGTFGHERTAPVFGGVSPGSDDELTTLARGLEIAAARVLSDPEEVRDVVQETLTRALAARQHGHLPEGRPPSAFVHGILRHVVCDVLRERREGRLQFVDVERMAALLPNALEHLIRREEVQQIERALQSLSAEERELLHLCYVEGERIVEIARRRGVPASRLRKRKSRALKQLRELLASARTPGGQVPGGEATKTGPYG